MAERPVPALADCDDVASRMQFGAANVAAMMRRATDAVSRFNDAIWPLVEMMPPGWFRDMEADNKDQEEQG